MNTSFLKYLIILSLATITVGCGAEESKDTSNNTNNNVNNECVLDSGKLGSCTIK